jgi:hypothetical protein
MTFYDFPRLNVARDNAEERIHLGFFQALNRGIHGRASNSQLLSQVFPLVEQLAARTPEDDSLSITADLRSVKVVAARKCFLIYEMKIGSNGISRISMRTESSELWVIAISTSAALQDLLREQPFPPSG